MDKDTEANKRKGSDSSSAKKNGKDKDKRVSIVSKVEAKSSFSTGSSGGRSGFSSSGKKSDGGSSSYKSQQNQPPTVEDLSPNAKLFRVTNPDISSVSAKYSAQPPPPPPPAPVVDKYDKMSDSSAKKQEDYYRSESEQSLSFEQGEIDFMDKSEGEEAFLVGGTASRDDLYGNYLEDLEEIEEEEELERAGKSRSMVLREMWESISADIRETFDSPSRVFKLRGYHSEPDLSLNFDDKFDLKFEPPKKGRLIMKSISYEDIVSASTSTKEHPNLVRGILSEVKLRAYAIDEKIENSWKELFDLEKKRFSFFDELFAMGYVVDSLEVLSPPPKGDDGKPITTGEYFIEADEKHYKKKVDYGRVVFKTKHVYTGNFHDWYFQGPGRYCWQDGTIYQGEFSQGLMHGPGSIHWPDGCVYEGHFIDGIRTGWGVYSSADGHTYAGEWYEGLPQGHGKMWYDPDEDDNDYYEGQWSRGQPNGIGTRQYATGDRYIGNWEKGMRNGYGIMIWLQERQVYKGEWLDGVPNGNGKHIWYLERTSTNSFPTRHVYQGQWVQGRREGIGKMIYPCGSVYEGRWKNGQRHGKGMFINPAGDILVGLFRAGAILGGSEVPLHAPTYECDYGGLSDWLTARFNLSLEDNQDNEETLLEITKRYLPFIRMLYHRAGEFSQKYGNHGLYPAYLKKSFGYVRQDHHHRKSNDSSHLGPHEPRPGENVIQHHREYTSIDEPSHMRGKLEKPESLDGVDPVTRFGLWLLMRDCDNLFDEVTMAYYDKIWCETPSISFQTRHNPFEPIYLWQFLQAIIATAVAYYVDIPRKRVTESDRVFTAEDIAVSDTTLHSGISYDEHKRQLIIRRHRARLNRHSEQSQIPITEVPLKGKSTHGNKGKSRKDSEALTIADKNKGKKHEGAEGGTKARTKSFFHKGTPGDSKNQEMFKADHNGRKNSKSSRRSKRKSVFPLPQKDSPRNHPAPEETSLRSFEFETADELETSVENDESEENETTFGEEEEEEEEEEVPQTPITIAQCFEKFINEKLLPCLKRNAGQNLPVVPQPLPALVDMYEAFKGIKGRDILRGTEFLRSTLPHLLFPNPKDVMWWHRINEPLSLKVDLNDLFEAFRQKFPDSEEIPEEEEDPEEKLESEYLGAQAQSSETTLRLLQICKDSHDPDACLKEAEMAEGHPVPEAEIPAGTEQGEGEEMDLMGEYTQDGHMFSEEELVAAPFLWADDYKCVPVPRKYQNFENIGAQDVIDVLSVLYPKLCQRQGHHEKNLHFELVFCDWLWCTSLLAKTSTEREFHEAWKVQPAPPTRPFTNPQSLGVFAHYIKQIKNNPYLSPTPPPDFVPKVHVAEPPQDENRGVQFSKHVEKRVI